MKIIGNFALALASTLLLQTQAHAAFEGRINALVTQGGQATPLLYTMGTNFWRIEIASADHPNPIDILDRNSSRTTILFPRNRSFVRLDLAQENGHSPPRGMPAGPAMPADIGPQAQSASPSPAGVGPSNIPGRSTMPQPPVGLPPGIGPQTGGPFSGPTTPSFSRTPMAGGMPEMPRQALELKATGEKTNLLGFACTRFEMKRPGETLEIWATDALPPFQAYMRNRPHRFGPRMIDEQWPELVKARKLFPLKATLKFDNGAERYRFEVTSVSGEKIDDSDGKLFQPPPDYHESRPLPF